MAEGLALTPSLEPAPLYKGLDSFMNLPVKIHVQLGRARIPIRQFLAWRQGSILELPVFEGEYVSVFANGKLVSRGEILVVEGNVGVRLTEIMSGQLDH